MPRIPDGKIFVIDKEDKRTDADIKTFRDVEEAKKNIERLRALKSAGAMGSGIPSGLGSSASTSR